MALGYTQLPYVKPMLWVAKYICTVHYTYITYVCILYLYDLKCDVREREPLFKVVGIGYKSVCAETEIN